MTPIPHIPAYLKRWSPAARLEECGKPHGYMIGDKEGLWYFASAVDERIAKLTAEVALLESTITGIQETAGKQEELIERLERENTRLKAPVSDEEWKPLTQRLGAKTFDTGTGRQITRQDVNAIIASRATRTPQADKEEK